MFWKKGIEIITPAIDSFVEYFKRDFDSLLEYMQQVEEQKQKEYEKKISYYLQQRQESQKRCTLYSETRNSLNNPDEKMVKRRIPLI